MNDKFIKSIFFLILVSFMVSQSVHSLEVETHEIINETVAKGTIGSFSLDGYLKNNLGVSGGINEFFNNKIVLDWIKIGGRYEDKPPWTLPYVRSVNHFHNPLTDQGFSGIWGTGNLSGVSSIQWSQWPLGAQTIIVLGSGNYSWHDARDYFYKALTANAKTTRETNFADTFRGLGQLMHLVEDLSVPEHTRDDGHYIFYNYEKWVKDIGNVNIIPSTGIISIRNADGQSFTNVTPIYFDPSSIGNPNPLASVPVANLFDTNQYNGYVSTSDVTLQNNIGLSEYTNANFLSPDSYFTSNFPYPNWGSVVEYEETVSGKNRTYLRKLGQGETESGKVGNGEHIEHLVLTGWLYKFLPGDLKKNALRPVYSDYAQKLIPRAVGYSAGLLDYFFRGTLEITMPDSYIYSITDGSVIPHQFTRLKAKVRNTTPNEEIQGCDIQQQNCIIQAVARYKKRTDYQPDLSTDPPTASSREPDYSYSVSAPIAITSLSSTTPTEFTFDFTSSPIPAGITDLYLHVIFKGTLGNETNIAIAVGMKDLNEPQHFSTWNATDYIYLDKILRTADEIRNNPTLLDRVDIDNDGIVNELDIGEPYIDPYDVTTMVAFYPTGVTPTIYNATYTPLPPGRYGRIILLTDMPEFYIRIHRESTNPQLSNTDADYLFSGVTNQENNGIFENTQVTTFRGIIQHHWSAYAWYFGDPDGISTAPWPPPAITNPYPAATLYP